VQQHSDTAAVLYLQKVNVVLLWSARDRRLMTLWYCFGNRFYYSARVTDVNSTVVIHRHIPHRVWNAFGISSIRHSFFLCFSLVHTIIIFFLAFTQVLKRKKTINTKLYTFFLRLNTF